MTEQHRTPEPAANDPTEPRLPDGTAPPRGLERLLMALFDITGPYQARPRGETHLRTALIHMAHEPVSEERFTELLHRLLNAAWIQEVPPPPPRRLHLPSIEQFSPFDDDTRTPQLLPVPLQPQPGDPMPGDRCFTTTTKGEKLARLCSDLISSRGVWLLAPESRQHQVLLAANASFGTPFSNIDAACATSASAAVRAALEQNVTGGLMSETPGGFVLTRTSVPIIAELHEKQRRLAAPRIDPDYHRVLSAMWVLECDESTSQGTAFAVDGIGLLTCEHAVSASTKAFQARAHDTKYPVSVIAQSKHLDLSVLRIATDLPVALRLDRSYVPEIGQLVTVGGFPNYQWGDTGYIVHQRVAGLRPASGHLRALTSGPIAQGMSGGPVINAQADVLGVVVSGAEDLSQANMTERHGFIPMTVVLHFLREHGLID